MAASMPTKRLAEWARLWSPVIGVMALIFYASGLPGKDIPALFPHEDILFHAAIYAILGLFFFRALKLSRPGRLSLGVFVLTVIFGFIYGASDEFHQMFVPGRDCSRADLLTDTIGSSIGAFCGGTSIKWLK